MKCACAKKISSAPTATSTRMLAPFAFPLTAPWISSFSKDFPCSRRRAVWQLKPLSRSRSRKRKPGSEVSETQFDHRRWSGGDSRPRRFVRAKLEAGGGYLAESFSANSANPRRSLREKLFACSDPAPRIGRLGPVHVKGHHVAAGERAPAVSHERRHRAASGRTSST